MPPVVEAALNPIPANAEVTIAPKQRENQPTAVSQLLLPAAPAQLTRAMSPRGQNRDGKARVRNAIESIQVENRWISRQAVLPQFESGRHIHAHVCREAGSSVATSQIWPERGSRPSARLTAGSGLVLVNVTPWSKTLSPAAK